MDIQAINAIMNLIVIIASMTIACWVCFDAARRGVRGSSIFWASVTSYLIAAGAYCLYYLLLIGGEITTADAANFIRPVGPLLFGSGASLIVQTVRVIQVNGEIDGGG